MKSLKALNIQFFDILVGIALVLACVLVPEFSFANNEAIVGAVTAIFAVIAGFFIVDATENYLSLQRLISEENAALISIGHSLNSVPTEMAESVRETIDTYMIAQLDIDNLDHTIRTRDEFDALVSTMDVVVGSNSDATQHIQEQKDRLILTNQEITLAAHQNMTATHWFVLFLLSGLVTVSSLALRDGSFGLTLLVAGILVGVQSIMVVLRDLDNNLFLQKKLAYRNPQQVFEAIKRIPYYPAIAPAVLRIPDKNGMYRTRQEGKIVSVPKG